MNEKLIKIIKFNKDGLVPAIAQQHDTGEVLMLAWMNKDSIQQTLTTNQVCYWSRSRKKLWRKGETSGNTQRLIEFRYDCDEDTILLIIDQTGAACHTGRRNCFYRVAKNESGEIETTLTEKKNITQKSKFDTNSNKKLNPTAIREEDVLSIQKEWADSIISIGKIFLNKGNYRLEAEKTLKKLYAFDISNVLFKPTFASQNQFRNSFEDALSYFVGGNIEEDNGFAIKPWFKIRFSENKIVISRDNAIAMGNYYFTSVEDKKNETKVEYTFGYIKDKKGNLRINLHHSSIPHSNN
jgi:phosphoribosyl-AMP cyclohydrolase|tara:strand:+ start:117 stop:1004 length:888 start_codon:yes stop_codon:yes gene_type:complete